MSDDAKFILGFG